jgi:hypothetical protein
MKYKFFLALGLSTNLQPDCRWVQSPIEKPLVLVYEFDRTEDRVTLNVVNYPQKKSDLFFFHLHMNEVTAKESGLAAVRDQGGTFISLDHGGGFGNREMTVRLDGITYTLDPNRIFTDNALLEKTMPKPTAKHLLRLKDFVLWIERNILTAVGQRNRKTVIGLHNNTDDDVNGELLSIRTEKKLIGIDNRAVNINPLWDIDNFFITTLEPTFKTLLQTTAGNLSLRMLKPRDIGYLSNWLIQKKIDYINVEAQIGDSVNNQGMIRSLQEGL